MVKSFSVIKFIIGIVIGIIIYCGINYFINMVTGKYLGQIIADFLIK